MDKPGKNPHHGTRLPYGCGTIVNERCKCGCYRTSHAGPLGHGSCEAAGCDCGKFTWTEFVLEHER